MRGVRVALRVIRDFRESIEPAYQCCVKGKGIVKLGEFDGCKLGTTANWQVAHRICGCELSKAGISMDAVRWLNDLNEGRELFSLKLLTEHGLSRANYYDDTWRDMAAVYEGYSGGGVADCYTAFIPRPECNLKKQ